MANGDEASRMNPVTAPGNVVNGAGDNMIVTPLVQETVPPTAAPHVGEVASG